MGKTIIMEKMDPLTVEPFEASEVVRQWRVDQFREMGFGPNVSKALGDTQVDVWHARRMLDQGAAMVNVIQILVGVTRYGAEDEIHSMEWFVSRISDKENLTSKELAAILTK